jgi:hypothetical protein
MREPADRTRHGVWAATGVYRWYAFSDDAGDSRFPVLDLQRRVRTSRIFQILNSFHSNIFFLRNSSRYTGAPALGNFKLLRYRAPIIQLFGLDTYRVDAKDAEVRCAGIMDRDAIIQVFQGIFFDIQSGILKLIQWPTHCKRKRTTKKSERERHKKKQTRC